MQHLNTRLSASEPYRIGWWTHRWWPTTLMLRCLVRGRDPQGRRTRRWYYVTTIARRLRMLQRPHRPWQSEAPLHCEFARRGITAASAQRKMQRDVDQYLLHDEPSPWQQRKAAARASRRRGGAA